MATRGVKHIMVHVLLTGTPGTGKTVIASALSKETGLKIIHINEEVGEDYLYIEDGSKVVDLKKLSKKIKGKLEGDCIIEGHLAQLLDIEGVVIVLRTHPGELGGRLLKKGFSGDKLEENLEAEALDIILIESLESHDEVYEIDTTGQKPTAVAKSIMRILKGEGSDFKPGRIDWLEEYLDSREAGGEHGHCD